MTRSTIGILASLLLAGFLAWKLGGRRGMGVIAGVLCGVSVTALGNAWLRHAIRTNPARMMRSVLESFLFKLAFAMLGALAFRFIEPAAARVDWRSFLVSFVAAVLVVLLLGLWDIAPLLKKSPVALGESEAPSLGESKAL